MHDHDHESGGPGQPGVGPARSRDRRAAAQDAARALGEGRLDVVHPRDLLDLQRAAGNAGVASALDEAQSPVHGVLASTGRPLEPEVRADMEQRFGQDFTDVRVHDDEAAHQSALAVSAHAYTVGNDLVFQRGRYDPSSPAGQLTLAHELTHVLQQRSGPVDGSPDGTGIQVSDPSDRFEREASATAERMVATAPVQRAQEHDEGRDEETDEEPG